MENEIKNNPMAMMLTMAVDSSMAVHSELTNIISKYKSNNIDVVPIRELEDCIEKSVKKSLGDDGLLKKMMH